MTYQLSPQAVASLRVLAERLLRAWAQATANGTVRCDTERWHIPEGQEEWSTHDVLMRAALGFGSKTASSLEAVLLLHEHALGHDALGISRSMWESLGKLKWITHCDWPQRLYEFEVARCGQLEKQWQELRKNEEYRELMDAEGARTPAFLAEARQRLGEKRVAEIISTWPPSGAPSGLELLGMRTFYDAWYRSGSAVIHANDIWDHADFDPAQGFRANLRGKWADMALAGSLFVSCEIIACAGEVLCLNLRATLDGIRAELEQLTRGEGQRLEG